MPLGTPGSVEHAAKRCCFAVGASASWPEESTTASDDTQSSGPVPNARLLSAEGASVFAQSTGDRPSKTQPASNALSLHQTLRAWRAPKRPADTLTR